MNCVEFVNGNESWGRKKVSQESRLKKITKLPPLQAPYRIFKKFKEPATAYMGNHTSKHAKQFQRNLELNSDDKWQSVVDDENCMTESDRCSEDC